MDRVLQNSMKKSYNEFSSVVKVDFMKQSVI